jgi:uncharacterized protein (TIGR02453 family)
MTRFTGIPRDAVDFYRELEGNNTKPWWEANKTRYVDHVREPMSALVDTLAPDFGEVSLFRPYRDVRFSADKSPYKEHQGALVTAAEGIGWYVAVGPDGLSVGAGFMAQGADQVARFRVAIDAESSGPTLVRLLVPLTAGGFEIGGDAVKTKPRGVAADHPRLELMRHKSLTLLRDYGTPAWLARVEALDRVRADWEALRPFVEWVVAYVGPTREARRR